MSLRMAVLCGTVLFTVSGCVSFVRSTRLRADYPTVDQKRVKRLVVVTQPLPDGKQPVGELWSKVARDYVNLKRQFMVKQNVALAQMPEDGVKSSTLCGENIEGVLWLKPKMTSKGDGYETELVAQLLRCVDGEEVWATEGGGSFKSVDDNLKEVTNQYVGTFGEEVRPYVAPTFNLLRAALDTLPDPVLNEQDAEEKMLEE
jgi:probable lipoprotein (TIGR04455 family)